MPFSASDFSFAFWCSLHRAGDIGEILPSIRKDDFGCRVKSAELWVAKWPENVVRSGVVVSEYDSQSVNTRV
jgi:hypothetical protein